MSAWLNRCEKEYGVLFISEQSFLPMLISKQNPEVLPAMGFLETEYSSTSFCPRDFARTRSVCLFPKKLLFRQANISMKNYQLWLLGGNNQIFS